MVSADPIKIESEEVWVIQNPGGGWRHPIHIHFEEHRVLSRDGVAIKPNTSVNGTIDYARRDVVPLNVNNEVRIFFRFRDMKGRYVMHCHNVVHEDHAMMIRWDIVKLTPWMAPALFCRAGRAPHRSDTEGNSIMDRRHFFVGAAAATLAPVRPCVVRQGTDASSGWSGVVHQCRGDGARRADVPLLR